MQGPQYGLLIKAKRRPCTARLPCCRRRRRSSRLWVCMHFPRPRWRCDKRGLDRCCRQRRCCSLRGRRCCGRCCGCCCCSAGLRRLRCCWRWRWPLPFPPRRCCCLAALPATALPPLPAAGSTAASALPSRCQARRRSTNSQNPLRRPGLARPSAAVAWLQPFHPTMHTNTHTPQPLSLDPRPQRLNIGPDVEEAVPPALLVHKRLHGQPGAGASGATGVLRHPRLRAVAGRPGVQPRLPGACSTHLLALLVAARQVVDEVPPKGANLVPHMRSEVGGLRHALQPGAAEAGKGTLVSPLKGQRRLLLQAANLLLRRGVRCCPAHSDARPAEHRRQSPSCALALRLSGAGDAQAWAGRHV